MEINIKFILHYIFILMGIILSFIINKRYLIYILLVIFLVFLQWAYFKMCLLNLFDKDTKQKQSFFNMKNKFFDKIFVLLGFNLSNRLLYIIFTITTFLPIIVSLYRLYNCILCKEFIRILLIYSFIYFVLI
jgi:hypothetical protein